MTFRKNMMTVFCAAGILALILDSHTALSGAASGIDLCMKTILPSLFPFLFLCTVITDILWDSQNTLIKLIGAKTGVPPGAESLLIAASLGGYPAGAQAVATAYAGGKLTRQDAEHLLTFCNNAGPAFLFGIVSAQFDKRSMVWALFAIHILAALWTGALFAGRKCSPIQLKVKHNTIPEILSRSVKTMAVICGWIILFRILTEYLSCWLFRFLPEALQVILSGTLELSNGCCNLVMIENVSARFLACSCLLSFGGLCITMQTASVIGRLSIKPYLMGKLLHTVFSMILSISYLCFGWAALIVAAACFVSVPKKTVDFQNRKVYNGAKIHERNQVHAFS